MKIKKFKKIENYLNSLIKKIDSPLDHLAQLTYKDLMKQPELKGIGERTIANTLNKFKQDYGIKSVKRSWTKRKRVEDYLMRLISKGQMTMEEMMKKSYADFQDVKDFQNIGKTTITCALSEFKKKHEGSRFEQSVLSFIENENGKTTAKQDISETSSASEFPFSIPDALNEGEIKTLKDMIAEYKQKSEDENIALQELMQALRFIGIDPSTLMERYHNGRKLDLNTSIDINIPVNENRQSYVYN